MKRLNETLPFRYSLKYTTVMHKKGAPAHKKNSSPGLRGRVWIEGEEGTFLGYGRIILLERVREFGSITRAAKSMEISYRHAWELVDSMNRQAGGPLVEAATGGKGGGGARLTEEGEKAVNLFWRFYKDFQEFLEREAKELGFPPEKKNKRRSHV